MNIGLNFHDTISYAPDYFCAMIKGWSQGKVYIITGTPASQKEEVERGLEAIGIDRGDYEEILCGYEYDKSEMNLSHFKRMAQHKLQLIKQHDIRVYYDDNPFYVSVMKDHGVYAFQPIMSDKYLKAFATADPFFTCNLQKMQFDYLEGLEDSEMKK